MLDESVGIEIQSNPRLRYWKLREWDVCMYVCMRCILVIKWFLFTPVVRLVIFNNVTSHIYIIHATTETIVS